MIGLASYDGKVVADGIARDLPDLRAAEPLEQDIEAEARRLERLRQSSGGGWSPAKVEERIRAVMWDKAGVEKDAASLRSALGDIERIRLELLPDMQIANRGKTANYEWLDAIDVVNMVETCELIIHSSLERQESRGPFFRRDFPLMDNQRWLAANVLRKSGNGLTFEQRPYELPFLKPDFGTRDNLEVAW